MLIFSGMNFPVMSLLLLAGVLLDLLFGEVTRWHPLIGFGNWAAWIEHRLNRYQHFFLRGVLAWLIVVMPPVILTLLLLLTLPALSWSALLLQSVLLYFCLGLRSLREHNLPIMQALKADRLIEARALTSRIVSRDTDHASGADLAKASTESLLENGNDAVFATLFWFVIAGASGALLYRLSNTLDAMWGYRTERFNFFGRAAARIDDGLNWIPARLTALSYILLAADMSGKRRAWHCWRTQAPNWPSPNAGPVMASGAGALGLLLGGDAVYHGVTEHRPILGAGQPAQPTDIARAWRLVAATTCLWLLTALLLAWLPLMLAFMESTHA